MVGWHTLTSLGKKELTSLSKIRTVFNADCHLLSISRSLHGFKLPPLTPISIRLKQRPINWNSQSHGVRLMTFKIITYSEQHFACDRLTCNASPSIEWQDIGIGDWDVIALSFHCPLVLYWSTAAMLTLLLSGGTRSNSRLIHLDQVVIGEMSVVDLTVGALTTRSELAVPVSFVLLLLI